MTDDTSITLTVAPRGTGEPITLPRVIGPYRVIRQIGVGGMGEVWLARDTALDRDVAMKFLPYAGSDEYAAQSLLEGVRRVCDLRQDGLVAVYAADVHDGVPFVVMEYINGPDLREVLAAVGPLRPKIAAATVHRIALAVGVLHHAGIVHRDIKPANVMIARDGRLLVTDFGLSQQRPIAELRGKTDVVGGTPAYMAPEVWDGEVSARSDVYALGILLFELIAGQPPFSGPVAEIERLHRNGHVPVERIDAAGGTLAQIIERATRRGVTYRFKDAGRLADTIAREIPGSADGDPGLTLLAPEDDRHHEDGIDLGTDAQDSSYYEALRSQALRKSTQRSERSQAVAALADPIPANPIPAAKGLEWSAPCVRCNYSLKGLPKIGQCPECELPIAESTDPRLMRMQPLNRLWLMRANARDLNVIISFSIFAHIFVPFILTWFLSATTYHSSLLTFFGLYGLLTSMAVFVATATYGIAGVLITNRQLLQAVRSAAILNACLSLFYVLLAWLAPPAENPSDALMSIYLLNSVCVVSVALPIARSPSLYEFPGLRTFARATAVLFGAVGISAVAWGVAIRFGLGPNPLDEHAGTGSVVLGWIALLQGLVLLASWFALLTTVNRYGRCVQAAIPLARARQESELRSEELS